MLKDGTTHTSIRENIRRGLAGGVPLPHAVAGAYEKARLTALVKGDMDSYSALVGADLPADILRMDPEETLAEMQRLDALSAKRGLSALEKQRLIDVELRMEQFAGGPMSDQDMLYYENLVREEMTRPQVVHKGPAQTFDLTLQEAKMGMWPLALAGLLFVASRRLK